MRNRIGEALLAEFSDVTDVEQITRARVAGLSAPAQGETIGHMAESMSLSVKTVSTYRTRVMEKMQLESNSDLTYYALKNGLIQ